MRIDHATQQAPLATAGPAPKQAGKHEKSHKPEHTPNGKAYGVVRKLGTDHFSPTAEARLTAHFGHLLPPPPPVDEAGDQAGEETIEEFGEDSIVDAPVDEPVDTPAIDAPTVALTYTADGLVGQTLELIGQSLNVVG